MSASLIVLIPVVLLGLVGALCFVGCILPTTGLPFQQGPYQGPIINNDPDCVAFWPLNEEAGPTAFDAIANPGPFNGTYLAGPMGGSVPMPGQPGIVPADIPEGASTANTCASFSNGMVSVDFQQALNPSTFTLECWVQPNWTSNDAQVQRAVLVSANGSPNMIAGVGLIATPDNFWEVDLAIVGQTFFPLKATQMINLAATNYLAVTYDGTMLSLFVGTVSAGVTTFTPFPPMTPPAKFVPEDSSTATPLFIGMGRPDMGGMFPFNGLIQDVAIYKTALSGPTIQSHFNNGTGLSS